jgi:hypothetical protein
VHPDWIKRQKLLSPGRESQVGGFYEGERRRRGTEFFARASLRCVPSS